MRGLAVAAGVLALLAGIVWAATTEDLRLQGAAVVVSVLVCAGAAIASRDMREDLARRLPPLAWIARGGFRLDVRRIAIAAAGIAAAFGLAEVIERETRPGGELAAHVEALAPALAERPPIQAAAELEREWPAEDQRYTPWGVFLRYEEDVVALLPRTVGTTVERLPAEAAYEKYGAIVGRFWGPAYHDRPRLRASAMAVPAEADLRAAAQALAAAEKAHRACYGWDVEIRSGVREGRLQGSGAGVGKPVETGCERGAVLTGFIDPRAGRFRRRGGTGRWALDVWRETDHVDPRTSCEAISVPFVEMIEGSTTEPSDGGAIAGKGLLEMIGAVPLLAQEADALAAVPLPPPRRSRGALAAVERSDAARRAEATGGSFVPAVLRVGAGFALVVLVIGLLAGLVARLIRALRGPA